ncbi:hypothetical protein BJX61DRAFT_549462 [Aspergillus egyptiacus]|nr:hypothetical protein BJX61DRAFT_549462 [Aspergillus egyptiacus]
MSRVILVLATLWLQLWLLPAALGQASFITSELVRVPRHVWDTAEKTAKRDETADADSVALVDHEEFMWASSDVPGEKAVVVSMVAYARQNERILDMDRFGFALDSASCSSEDMHLKFKHRLIYLAAKIAWQWVNYNDLRSFVLVPSWEGCGEDKSHDPWVVTRVEFDDQSQRVNLVAAQSTWKKVMSTVVLDFGEVVLGRSGSGRDDDDGGDDKRRRDIIPDLDARFRLNLDARLPQQIFKWQVNRGVLNASVTANCNDCGTSGTLVFAGHVEASLGWGGFDVDKFEISVRPQGVQAHVGLSLDFQGHLDYTGLVRPSQEFEILEIPVSGWNIRGVFEFGPRILLNAGYEIDYIEGVASVGTGITARIPDSAVARLDLLAEDSVQVSGWEPVIETEPLQAMAQVNAQASLYTEIALSVSLTVLDDNGFGVDLALKVPEVTVTASAGGNTEGFCEDDPDPWGIMVEASVGASLELEGWHELDGDREELFDVDLFTKDDLYVFPQFCFSFGGLSDGFCLAEESLEEEEEDEDDDDDDDDDDDRAAEKRAIQQTDRRLSTRQDPDRQGRTVRLACDNEQRAAQHPIQLLDYPRPADIRTDTDVPIAKPTVPCWKSEKNCAPKDADIVIVTEDQEERAIVEEHNRDWFFTEKEKRWDSEHIYEGNWIAKYIGHVGTVGGWVQGPGEGCHDSIIELLDGPPPADNPKPAGADEPDTLSKALMQHLGTTATFKTRMAILQSIQNNLKYQMFNKDPLIPYFEQDEDNSRVEPYPNSHGRRACDLARIVSTCKYMAKDAILTRLKATVLGIEGVLRKMDADPTIPKPKADFSYEEEHAVFFNKTWTEGFAHARDSLEGYAQWLSGQSGAQAELGPVIWNQIQELANGGRAVLDTYCPERDLDEWLRN